MEKKEQLQKLIEYYTHGNKSQFAKMLGISAQGLSTWISRNTYDSERLFAKCEGLSAKWLLAGEGEMIIKEAPAPQPQPQQPNDDSAATPALDELAELRRSLLQLIENNGKLIESNAMLVDSNRQLVQNQQTQFERLIRLVDK